MKHIFRFLILHATQMAAPFVCPFFILFLAKDWCKTFSLRIFYAFWVIIVIWLWAVAWNDSRSQLVGVGLAVLMVLCWSRSDPLLGHIFLSYAHFSQSMKYNKFTTSAHFLHSKGPVRLIKPKREVDIIVLESKPKMHGNRIYNVLQKE